MPCDPFEPLEYAPTFTADGYQPGQPGEVRIWRGASGRLYAELDGWFVHKDAAAPQSVLAAWFFDGPMEDITSEVQAAVQCTFDQSTFDQLMRLLAEATAQLVADE